MKGLCSSKIFVSDQNLFIYLEKYVGYKDNLMAETRKVIYKIISKYIKLRKELMTDYFETIYVIIIYNK